MLIKSICLGPAASGAPGAALRDAATALLRASTGLREVQALRVLRHIPTDSLNDRKAPAGVTPQADDIACVLQLHFEDAAAADRCAQSPAWAAFMQQVRAAAPVLFSVDSEANIPVAPRAGAVDGGFRRWMLLTRKPATLEAFRDGWFGLHAQLVSALPNVDGYYQNLVTRRWDAEGREVDYQTLPVDGIAELCYADEAAMEASYASPQRDPVREDGRGLLGRITTILVQGEAWR